MDKHDCRIGMRIYFGRPNGEQTLAVIEKINPTKCKVRIVEDRGQQRTSAAGTTWTVPYGMMRPADGATAQATLVPVAGHQSPTIRPPGSTTSSWRRS
jgi:hypothetical protein